MYHETFGNMNHPKVDRKNVVILKPVNLISESDLISSKLRNGGAPPHKHQRSDL